MGNERDKRVIGYLLPFFYFPISPICDMMWRVPGAWRLSINDLMAVTGHGGICELCAVGRRASTSTQQNVKWTQTLYFTDVPWNIRWMHNSHVERKTHTLMNAVLHTWHTSHDSWMMLWICWVPRHVISEEFPRSLSGLQTTCSHENTAQKKLMLPWMEVRKVLEVQAVCALN